MTTKLLDNAIYEGDETFSLDLLFPIDAIFDNSQGIVTIHDDADLPSFSIDDVLVNEAAGTAKFTITKTGATEVSAFVDYQTVDGTARAGDDNDYVSTAGTLTFLAADTEKTVEVEGTPELLRHL